MTSSKVDISRAASSSRSPETRIPIILASEKPSFIGFVIATICMTCVLIRFATRWRTLASDMLRSAAILVKGRRPSCCNASMMRWSISSTVFF